jgi:hypothetical protein
LTNQRVLAYTDRNFLQLAVCLLGRQGGEAKANEPSAKKRRAAPAAECRPRSVPKVDLKWTDKT